MKKLLLLLLFISSLLFSKSTFKGNLLLESDSYWASGDKEGKKDSTFFSSELGLNYLNKQKDYQYGFMINSKFYEDKFQNKKVSKVSKLKIFYKTKTLNLEFGDVANSINPYVYSGSIKGLKVNKFLGAKKNEGLNLFFISGYKTRDWNDAFRSHSSVAKGAATEAKYLFSRYKYLALSASSAKVDESGQASEIVGFQSRWRFSRKAALKTSASLAKAKSESNATTKDAKAFKIQIDFKPQKNFKAKFKYEIVDSNYDVLFGKGAKDREKFQGDFNFKLNKGTYFKVLLKRYRDNIDGSLGESRYTTDKRVIFSTKPEILSKGTFSLELKRKLREGRGMDSLSTTRGVKLSKYVTKNFKLLSSYQTKEDKDNLASAYTLKSNNLKLGWKLKGKIDKYEKFDLSFLLNSGKYIYSTRSKDRMGYKFSGKYSFNKYFYLKFLLSTKQNDDNLTKTINNTFSLSGEYKLKTSLKQSFKFLLEKKTYSNSDSMQSDYNQYRAKLTYKLNF